MEEIRSLTCPITGQIFKDPVMAEDGYIYEKTAIKDWFRENNTSPLTNLEISKTLNKCYTFNAIVEEYLQFHPQERDKQYKLSTDHLDNVQKIKSIINKKKFNKLLKYRKFDLGTFYETNQILTIIDCENKIIKHIIDNVLDIDAKNYNGFGLLHLCAKYGKSDIILYLINKGVKLEEETNYGNRPIHIIAKYASSDVLKYIINKEVSLDCKNIFGCKPIHVICKYSTFEIIQFVLNREIEIDHEIPELLRINNTLSLENKVELINFANRKIIDNIEKHETKLSLIIRKCFVWFLSYITCLDLETPDTILNFNIDLI